MSPKPSTVWVLSAVCFFLISFGILFFYTKDDFFCSEPSSPTHIHATMVLALAVTGWNLFAITCGAAIRKLLENGPGVPVLVTTLIAELGFASIPFWIYRGYGVFLFENTWADV